MALSTLSDSVSHINNSIREQVLGIRDHLQTRHWIALGLGLVGGVAAWKLISRPAGIPPGPRGYPVVGNLHQISDSLHLDFMRIGKKYGDIFSLYFGPKLLIVLNSHQIIKEAFVTSGPMFADRHDSIFLPEIQGGLFNMRYNDKFVSLKKHTIMALRSTGYGTKEGEKRIQDGLDDLIQFLQQKKPSEAVTLDEPLQKVFANIFVKILVGKQFDWDDPRLQELLKDLNKFMKNFTELALLSEMLPKWMSKLLFGKSLKQFHDSMYHFGKTYVEPLVTENKENSDDRSTFVSFYLKGDDTGEVWTMDKVLGFCTLFFPDAVVSTSHLVQWNVLLFTYYPEIQEKMQQEIQEVVGSNRPGLSIRSKMNYTQAFLLESLRFSTIFSTSAFHKPLKNTTLAGYNIPEHAVILANVWAVNMDPTIWEEPNKFKPDRHLDEHGNFVQKDNVIIFGQGRRMCIGEQLVKSELFLATVYLLQHFTFRFSDNQTKPELKPEKETFFRNPPSFKVCITQR